MIDNNYFLESIPDGISNAINDYDESIDCCNQDSYDILLKTISRTPESLILKKLLHALGSEGG